MHIYTRNGEISLTSDNIHSLSVPVQLNAWKDSSPK